MAMPTEVPRSEVRRRAADCRRATCRAATERGSAGSECVYRPRARRLATASAHAPTASRARHPATRAVRSPRTARAVACRRRARRRVTGRGQRVGEFVLEVGVPTGLPRRHMDLPARRGRAVRSVDQLVERGELPVHLRHPLLLRRIRRLCCCCCCCAARRHGVARGGGGRQLVRRLRIVRRLIDQLVLLTVIHLAHDRVARRTLRRAPAQHSGDHGAAAAEPE